MARLLILAAFLSGASFGSAAQTTPPSFRCETSIAIAERAAFLPFNLLGAVARVESGRFDPGTGGVSPWPWTINADGTGRFFASKDDAIQAVRDLQAQGVRSIDVGCLQVNLMHHPDAFGSLEEAFDPDANAAYAARFLRSLYAERLDWAEAAGAYHSRTPEVAVPYRQRVLAAWGRDGRVPGATARPERAAKLLPAGPRPPVRPFVLPLLAGEPNPDPRTRAAGVERLLASTPECAAAVPQVAWGAPPHTPACSGSPFASTALLQRVLAAE
jgi:hypothetical protein